MRDTACPGPHTRSSFAATGWRAQDGTVIETGGPSNTRESPLAVAGAVRILNQCTPEVQSDNLASRKRMARSCCARRRRCTRTSRSPWLSQHLDARMLRHRPRHRQGSRGGRAGWLVRHLPWTDPRPTKTWAEQQVVVGLATTGAGRRLGPRRTGCPTWLARAPSAGPRRCRVGNSRRPHAGVEDLHTLEEQPQGQSELRMNPRARAG